LFSVGDNEQTGPYAVATGVTVPVLLAVGGADGNVCNAGAGSNCADAKTFRAAETSYYPEERSLDAFVLPRAGHFMNYELNASAWFRAALTWTRRVAR
jgi:alpha-beta hydrolase superfamily lysophospholipase